METIDLGLSAEGESANNRSVRDRNNAHQRSKGSKLQPAPLFIPNSSGAVVIESSGSNALVDVEDAAAINDDGEEGEEGACEVRGSAVTAPSTKRRRIQFKSNVRDDEEERTEDINQNSTAVDNSSSGAGAAAQREVYHQNDMTDAQFLTLQNRIKNRPMSAVNGCYEMHVARPSMKGHTAFLTFAVCPLQK